MKRPAEDEGAADGGALVEVKRAKVDAGELVVSGAKRPEIKQVCAGGGRSGARGGRWAPGRGGGGRLATLRHSHLPHPRHLLQQGPDRTSALQAPIMLLSGHGDAVFSMRFNPKGDCIASGSHDKHIFLWRTYGDCENYMMLKGGWDD